MATKSAIRSSGPSTSLQQSQQSQQSGSGRRKSGRKTFVVDQIHSGATPPILTETEAVEFVEEESSYSSTTPPSKKRRKENLVNDTSSLANCVTESSTKRGRKTWSKPSSGSTKRATTFTNKQQHAIGNPLLTTMTD